MESIEEKTTKIIEGKVKQKRVKSASSGGNQISFLVVGGNLQTELGKDGEWISQFDNVRGAPESFISDLLSVEEGEIWRFQIKSSGRFWNITALEKIRNAEPGETQESTPTETKENEELKDKRRSVVLSYAKDIVTNIYSAQIQAGQEVPPFTQIETDVIVMADSLLIWIEK